MKKFAFLTAILLALGLSACFHDGETSTPDTQDTQDDEQVQDDEDQDDTDTDDDTPAESALVSYIVPKALDESTVLKNRKKEILNNYNKDYGYAEQPSSWDSIEYLFEFFEAGTFKAGAYKDQKLVVIKLNCEGPCFRSEIHRFAWDAKADTLTHLSKNSDPIAEYTPSYVTPLLAKVDNQTTLPELIAPKTLTAPNGEIYQLSQQDAIFGIEPSEKGFMSDLRQVFSDPKYGKIYKIGENGCVYTKSPDGSYHRFEYNPNFVEGFAYDTLPKLRVTWDDGSKTTLTGNYHFAASGCGITGACFNTFDFNPESLTLAGTSDKGHKFYEAKNPKYLKPEEAVVLSTMTPDSIVSGAYDNYKTHATYAEPPRTALSFENWLKTHPILFFKDPLGAWSYLLNNESRPVAECGKPVIYLYPERTTDVNVQVAIDEFTETIPAYGPQGWTVKAQPNGEIYNYADGRTYPYLFWEGHKKGLLTSTEGFVVARKDLKNFFEDSLKKLGLNRTERKDFIEYWHTNMLASYKEPYFFISWVGTKDFNRVAPLQITPQPDTLIRVFMFQQPLTHPIKVKEQKLSTIPRRGFTVIEWGGTPKPWTK